MKKFLLSLGIAASSLAAFAQYQKFDQFSADFVREYKALKLPDLDLSYVSGFQHIQSADSIEKQLEFFSKVKSQLTFYTENGLTLSQRTDYELIKYETSLNLERIALEQQWLKEKPSQIPAGGIITVPNGKAWYAYLLKRWVGDDVTPDQVYQFGLGEVKRVQGHIDDVRKRTGLSEDEFYKHLNDSSFLTSDPKEVQRSFEHTKAVVYSNLHKLFSDTIIPSLKVERGESK
ncbi:MAG: DUF885 family protein, partial [Mucilaginibacter sp.]